MIASIQMSAKLVSILTDFNNVVGLDGLDSSFDFSFQLSSFSKPIKEQLLSPSPSCSIVFLF